MSEIKENSSLSRPLAILFFVVVVAATIVLSYALGGQDDSGDNDVPRTRVEAAFKMGAQAHLDVPKDKITATCAKIGSDLSLFCLEGFFFADLVLRPSLENLSGEELNKNDFDGVDQQLQPFVRSIWLTSLGLALAQRNINPTRVPALMSNPAALAQAIDGWAFRRYQLTGPNEQALWRICNGLQNVLYNACQFGMGRASYFDHSESFSRSNTDIFFRQGHAFALAYAATKIDPGQPVALPSERGGKAAVLLKQAWMGDLAHKDRYFEFYDCTLRVYFGSCLERIN